MARETPFTWLEMPRTMRGGLTYQQIKNEYYYEMLGYINTHMVKWSKTFEWKAHQMEKLKSICGEPVKLTKMQNFLANYLML